MVYSAHFLTDERPAKHLFEDQRNCINLLLPLGSEELFVIIHNIDGAMLRSKKVSPTLYMNMNCCTKFFFTAAYNII